MLIGNSTIIIQDYTLREVKISATIRTYVLRAPRPNSELVATFDAGAEESAYGRDADGKWLRIMAGWVLAEVFNTEGEIGALPDTTNSFNVTLISATRVYGGPSEKWFESSDNLERGAHSLAIGRNEDATWLKLPVGWVMENRVRVKGDISQLPVTPSGVIITAKTRTFILKEPDLSAEFVDVFEEGEEELAIGRSADGEWLETVRGWLPIDAVEARGGEKSMRFSIGEVEVNVGSLNKTLYEYPDYDSPKVRTLRYRSLVVAIARSADGKWLQSAEGGWFSKSLTEANADIMGLPVLSSLTTERRLPTTSRSTSTVASTLDSRAIRALIARHTDDIRILDIETASNATTIEYDLKPWPFVPNESIADEVAFKIICAIRNGQKIPKTLKFIGHTHFKSDVGRKFTGPSVEMHISAGNANRIVCRGNDPSDINWRRVASRYKSYPIPRGASIDYD